MRALLLMAGPLFWLVSSVASAADPALTTIIPRGVQRGVETTVSFQGARLADAEEVLFYLPGMEATKIEPDGANNLKVTLKVAPDCLLGEHTVQVRTKSGITDYRSLYVGVFPEQAEKEPNSSFDEPQALEMNVCVNGIVQNEDVDYYVVTAKKGQRISAEIEGMRLGTTLFDPYLAILNDKRFELVASDDTPLVKQDAVCSVVAPEDGKYIIEVREAAYGGNGSSHYRLHVGTYPRPLAIYPAGGPAGQATEVQFIGDPSGVFTATVNAPNEPGTEYPVVPQDAAGIAPSPNMFRISPFGNSMEVEPNDDFQTASSAELPNAFNGIIEKDGDVDVFRFSAKKGQTFEVECFARRIRSPLDAVMNVYSADGKSIAGNDDSRGPDSYLRFAVPADGEYLLRITDHLQRGGPEFVYRVEFLTVERSLTLGIPRVARYSQSRQRIVVPRGNRFATLISASRTGFGGEIKLDGTGLPAGMVMHAEPMRSNLNVMPVVFEAAADAPVAGHLQKFTARPVDENVDVVGAFENRADYVIGNPGQSLYVWKDVNQLPFAVVEEVPFHLELVTPKVPIVRDGSMQLKVVVHKKEGWDEQVNVQFPFRPPGIGATSSINIPKGQNEGFYPLSANGSAPLGEWKVFVLGTANVGGAVWVSSELTRLEIAEPYVGFELAKADVEQGQETEVVAKITQNKAVPGVAKVELIGLPNRVTTEPLELKAGVEELVFKVKTDPASPAGTHKNIFCQVTVIENGEPIVHARVGATELRIDKPLPPKVVAQAKPEPKPAAQPMPAETKPPEKRLTRLEKLRLEAKERTGADGGE